MRCKYCGCSEFNACVDLGTGTTCDWVLPGVCSFCVEHDPIADFILGAQFAHETAALLTQFDHSAVAHAEAKALYDQAVAA